jgi:tetratricopeptide (TPR) repeat protein
MSVQFTQDVKFAIASPYRPYAFNESSVCPIFSATFADLIQQKISRPSQIREAFTSQGQGLNREVLEIINEYDGTNSFLNPLGETHYFVALVKDKSQNSALYSADALAQFYASKTWEVFENPINRQKCESVEILGVYAKTGEVRRYQTCSTPISLMSYLSNSSHSRNISSLLKDNLTEEELLNWIEMEMRTNGRCNDLDIKKIIDFFRDNPVSTVTKIEEVLNRFSNSYGYEVLARFFYRRDHELFNPTKSILYYEKLLHSRPAIRKNSYDSDDYENLAELYLEVARPDIALTTLHQAMKGNPDRRIQARRHLLGKIHVALGDHVEAQKSFQAIVGSPDDSCLFTDKSYAFIELAKIARVSGRFQAAHEYLEAALKAAVGTYGWEHEIKKRVQSELQVLISAEKAS